MSGSANIRQNLQISPSIFEISAAETLDELIYPSLSRIFKFLDIQFSHKFNYTVYKYIFEELPLLITWFLQHLYLKRRGASFGESFYGLQRVQLLTGDSITVVQRFLSAGFLTSLPFIENKLRAKEQEHRIKWWERYFLNGLHVYKAYKALNIFMYLIRFTNSHSPLFRLLKLCLRYPVESNVNDKATDSIVKLLEIIAFFLQFIQWWYNDLSSDRRRKIVSLVNPPPLKFSNKFVKQGECPLCLMQLHIPTACAISGYVFCWRCISNYMKNHNTCPITGYFITKDDLVRVYETE